MGYFPYVAEVDFIYEDYPMDEEHDVLFGFAQSYCDATVQITDYFGEENVGSMKITMFENQAKSPVISLNSDSWKEIQNYVADKVR